MNDSLTLSAAESEITAEQRRALDAILADDELRPSAGATAINRPVSVIKRWLQTQSVRNYLGAALAERRARHADVRDRVIQALYGLATYDIADAIDTSPPPVGPADLDDDLHLALSKMSSGGRLRPPHELPPALRAAVKKVKHTRWGWEYEFVDRSAILLALLRHFGDIDKFGVLESGSGSGVEIFYFREDKE